MLTPAATADSDLRKSRPPACRLLDTIAVSESARVDGVNTASDAVVGGG